jgi:hypothetical protein
MLPKICSIDKACREKPYLKRLFWIRGIMRRRFYYCNEREALQEMEQAHRRGVTLEDLEDIAKSSSSWSEWRDSLWELVDTVMGGTE